MKSTVYFAKWMLLPDGSICSNGALVVTGDTITSLGRRSTIKRSSKDRVVNLGKRILLPGLINMHTHLEDGFMRGTVSIHEAEPFLSRMLKKELLHKNASRDEIRASVRLGIRESLANGITTIVDSSRTDVSPEIFREEAARAWIIHEVYSLEGQSLIDSLEKRTRQRGVKENIGVGPYALFSLTPPIHKLLVNFARLYDYTWATHIAESAEELQAFSEHAGDLFFHLGRKASWPYGESRRGAMHYAICENLIPHGGILYHCNYAGTEELSLLAAKNVSIVICNQYSDFSGDKRFPLEPALKRGINICLGTESPVSSLSMNLFDEIYALKAQYPHIPYFTMFNWITKNSARALRCTETLGGLVQGKKADIIGIPLLHEPHTAEDIFEEIFQNNPSVDFVMVGGEEIVVGS
jgi:cytosine/adenosine deaminase-related metal-dependent hydrolase